MAAEELKWWQKLSRPAQCTLAERAAGMISRCGPFKAKPIDDRSVSIEAIGPLDFGLDLMSAAVTTANILRVRITTSTARQGEVLLVHFHKGDQ